MRIKDLFEREIEKIALALGKLMGVLGHLRQINNLEEATKIAQSGLEDLFSIKRSDILQETNEQFEKQIEKQDSEYLRALGNLLFELAEIERLKDNETESLLFANRSKICLQQSNLKSKTIHFETMNKLDKINDWI